MMHSFGWNDVRLLNDFTKTEQPEGALRPISGSLNALWMIHETIEPQRLVLQGFQDNIYILALFYLKLR